MSPLAWLENEFSSLDYKQKDPINNFHNYLWKKVVLMMQIFSWLISQEDAGKSLLFMIINDKYISLMKFDDVITYKRDVYAQ